MTASGTQPTPARQKPAGIAFLSVAAPAYNEEAGIAEVLAEWLAWLRQSDAVETFEIVICNDGSRDGTGRLLDAIAGKTPELRPVHHPKNRGAAAALATAIRHTRGDWVLLIDSDGQFPISNLAALVEKVQSSRDLAVIGVRPAKQDGAFARFGSWSSALLCNWVHGSHCRDFNSACKLVHGPLLRSLRLEAKGLNYSTEVTSRLLELGIHLAEVDITHLPRQSGKSSLRALRGARDRFLFVCYIAFRQFLFRLHILEKPSVCS